MFFIYLQIIATVTNVAGNIESKIQMFNTWDGYYKCGNDKGHLDHDVFLAIVDWTPGGHGAFIQSIEVRGARESMYNSDPATWPQLTPAIGSNRVLACKIGYQANVDKTNCEPYDVEKCAMNDGDKLANLCTNQIKGNYDKSQHKFEYDADNTCYVLRCRQNGYGFTDPDTQTCGKCITDARQGIHPRTGECVDCPTGKIFSAKAASAAYCAMATAYTHDNMKYGPVKAKSLNNQCWTMGGDAYTQCVAGKK